MPKKLVKSKKLVGGARGKSAGVVRPARKLPHEQIVAMSNRELRALGRQFGNPNSRAASKVRDMRIHNSAVEKTVAQKRGKNPQYVKKTINGREMESFAVFDQNSRHTIWRQAAQYRKDGFASASSTAERSSEDSTDIDYYGYGVRVWKSVKKLKKDEKAIQNFHKFSLFVWLVWLIPYFSPMFFQLAI